MKVFFGFFWEDLAQIKTKSKQHHDILLTLSWPAAYFNEKMEYASNRLGFKRKGCSSSSQAVIHPNSPF